MKFQFCHIVTVTSVFIGPSWSAFSLALVLFGLCACVCNKSLKSYRGEIISPCYSDGHYQWSTCITSSLLIGQSDCWGAALWTVFVSVQMLGCVHLCMCGCAHFVCNLFLLRLAACACSGSDDVSTSVLVSRCSAHWYGVFVGVCACK